MDDFIVLRCPACGGQIQVMDDLDKLFCVHCGTQLLLRKGADGLLAPIKARELAASARLMEMQAAQLTADHLQNQIDQLKKQAEKIRHDLLQYCRDNQVDGWGREAKGLQLVNQYTRQITGRPQLTRDILRQAVSKDARTGEWNYHLQVVENLNLPALNTPEDMHNLYQFLSKNSDKSKEARQLLNILQPISSIWPELAKRLQEYRNAREKITNNRDGM
jgi:hypothetical protein